MNKLLIIAVTLSECHQNDKCLKLIEVLANCFSNLKPVRYHPKHVYIYIYKFETISIVVYTHTQMHTPYDMTL